MTLCLLSKLVSITLIMLANSYTLLRSNNELDIVNSKFYYSNLTYELIYALYCPALTHIKTLILDRYTKFHHGIN